MHDSMSNLKELQPEVKTKLASQGIRTTTQLLEHTRTQKQCAELAHEVGTTLVAIKELANRADLLVDDKARASAADQLLSSAEAEAEKQRLSTEKQAAKDALSVPTPDPRGIHGFYINPKKST